jgi:hypothetical protein
MRIRDRESARQIAPGINSISLCNFDHGDGLPWDPPELEATGVRVARFSLQKNRAHVLAALTVLLLTGRAMSSVATNGSANAPPGQHSTGRAVGPS